VLVAGVLVCALAVAALVVLPRSGVLLRERCVVTADGEEFTFSPEQTANAATIAAVGMRTGTGERGVVIALATAIQESKLRNLDHGDRDSLGLFQQRPSQGWGTAEQVRDPIRASEQFYAALRKVKGYESLPLTEAAQRVQRSGFPLAYAAHEDEAAALAGPLTGRRPEALSCSVRPDAVSVETVRPSGLTPRADRVRREAEAAFGDLSLGGFAPGGVSTGHIEGSAHYEGRAIDVMFRPVDDRRRRAGWATATWLVANAERLDIATVIYSDRIWTSRRSSEGWRPYVHPSGNRTDPTLRHLDHVHVDVLEGD